MKGVFQDHITSGTYWLNKIERLAIIRFLRAIKYAHMHCEYLRRR